MKKMHRPKIAVVAGELRHPRILTMVAPLRDVFDVTVYALDGERLLDRHGTGLKVRVFENINDMPGYLRGLEEELASADFILGFETSRLGTFQAVRAARRHGIPMGVVVSEFHPFFYEKYANIRAIQFDICNKAERFWVTSQASADCLKLDYVPKESVGVLGPAIDQSKFKPSPAGREKFRKYVGIEPDDFVVLFHHELEAWNRPEVLVQAMATVRKQLGPSGARLRAMFVGQGAAAMDLKYRSFDLGLGKQIKFLHQDPEPFIVDLYAAADLQLVPRAQRTEFHEDFPLPVLEGMATGLVPLVGAGSLAQELAGGVGYVFADDTPQSLAAELFKVLQSPTHHAAESRRAVERVEARFSVTAVTTPLVADIRALLVQRGTPIVKRSADDVVASVRDDLSRGAEQDALVKIEEAMLGGVKLAPARAELFCLRGDAYYGLGEIEKAMQSYSEAMKLNDKDFRALRGLGFVAWQGHSNEEALVFFKKAIALKEDDGDTMLGIGLVFRRLGLNDEALFWLEKSVLAPVPPAAGIVALAQACAQTKTAAKGIAVLERVIDALGENHSLMVTLGQLYLNDGQTEEGNAILQKALSGPATA
jgi:glycosyltransferase involved in cell wall biosynthesis